MRKGRVLGNTQVRLRGRARERREWREACPAQLPLAGPGGPDCKAVAFPGRRGGTRALDAHVRGAGQSNPPATGSEPAPPGDPGHGAPGTPFQCPHSPLHPGPPRPEVRHGRWPASQLPVGQLSRGAPRGSHEAAPLGSCRWAREAPNLRSWARPLSWPRRRLGPASWHRPGGRRAGRPRLGPEERRP